MGLDAFTYHMELDASQRDAVNRWLVTVVGENFSDQMIESYEVVGEGQVRIVRFTEPGTTIEFAPTPPPVWR